MPLGLESETPANSSSYFFGGLPPYEEDGYGFSDVWILSIPSFTWVKVGLIGRRRQNGCVDHQQYYADNTGQHHSLSADVVR